MKLDTVNKVDMGQESDKNIAESQPILEIKDDENSQTTSRTKEAIVISRISR